MKNVSCLECYRSVVGGPSGGWWVGPVVGVGGPMWWVGPVVGVDGPMFTKDFLFFFSVSDSNLYSS